MGQIVELRRRRPYGAVGVTNGNRASAVTNKMIRYLIQIIKRFNQI